MRATRVFATFTLLALAACPGTKTIKELLDDPGRYEGETVRITGTVDKAVGALGFGGYQVNDGTGSMIVIIQSGGATPRVGATVGVEGTFRSAFTAGPLTAAVLIEKQHRVR